MPYATVHILTAVLLVCLYRDFFAKKKPLDIPFVLLAAGFAGILPDIDIIFEMIAIKFNFNLPILLQHGMFTHTLAFALIFALIGIILRQINQEMISKYFYIMAFGIVLHMTLDYLLGGAAYDGVMWFFPLSISAWKLDLLHYYTIHQVQYIIDILLLFGWIIHLESKHKISSFMVKKKNY